VARYFAKSDQRKPWNEIFFNGSEKTPVTEIEAGPYKDVLDMVQAAPSAANTQPWRIVKRENAYDLYIENKFTSEKSGQKLFMGYNDIGIAKIHFQLAANERGLAGSWVQVTDKQINLPDMTYVMSWKV